MPALRMSLYKSFMSPLYKMVNPVQNRMYNKILSFEGALAFASEHELIVQKTDGTVFRSPLQHYESDYITETYVGRMDGEQFRFLFASSSNPLAQIDPMVTFASMSTSGWAIHFKVHP